MKISDSAKSSDGGDAERADQAQGTLTAVGKTRATSICRPSSYLEPLDLGDVFCATQPLEIEIGCGDGSFLAAYAGRHPECNFLGVERLSGRLRKVDKKIVKRPLVHVVLMRIEAGYFLRYLLPSRSAAAVHIYFPDPWPKKRHHKHRLVQDGFPGIMTRILARGGRVYFRTDDVHYFAQIKQVFRPHPSFVECEVPMELAMVRTDFERDFNAAGIPTLRLGYQLVEPRIGT